MAFSWTLANGLQVVMPTFRAAAGESVATCPAGTSCTVQSARRLLVVSRMSDEGGIRKPSYVRLNVVETLQVDGDGDGDLEVIDRRANFYQRDVGGSREM